jgi:hypothetical protein
MVVARAEQGAVWYNVGMKFPPAIRYHYHMFHALGKALAATGRC